MLGMRNLLLRVVVGVLVALLVPVAVGAAHATTAFDAVFAPRSDRPAVGAPVRPHDPTRPTAVVVLGTHGTVVSDALAPYEILAATGAFNLYTVAERAAPVPLTGGLDVVPDLTFDQLDARLGGSPQLVVVPAMADTGTPTAAPVTDWLRRTAARGSLLLSVCNGAELLASAGLLDGRRATAHWAALDDYATAYPATTWLRGVRFVEDGADRVTTAGILAGIDGTLRVVERMLGGPAAARAAAAIGWSHWAPGPARSGPQATQAPADAVALLNAGFAWGAPTYGVALTPGVGELELSSVFETYGGQTLATRTVALSPDGGPVVSRHGLVFVPRGAVGAVAVDRLLVPGAGVRRVPMPGTVAPEYPHARPGFAFDGVLTDVARHLDVATARFAAKSMEYPLGRLDLTGPSWPWALLLRVAALAAAGAALGIGLTRTLGRRRVPAPV
jgi:putative intracellular protease/amidase